MKQPRGTAARGDEDPSTTQELGPLDQTLSRPSFLEVAEKPLEDVAILVERTKRIEHVPDEE
jgi:hypothetical protein